MKKITNNGGVFADAITESDFILRLVDIFCENGIECAVSGERELTVTDENTSFILTVESKSDR